MNALQSLKRRAEIWRGGILDPFLLNSACDENVSVLSAQLRCTGWGLKSPRSIPPNLLFFSVITLAEGARASHPRDEIRYASRLWWP